MIEGRLSNGDRRRMVLLLQHFHKLGYSLQDCSHPQRLNRSPEKLLPLAREAGVVFSDTIEISERLLKLKRKKGK